MEVRRATPEDPESILRLRIDSGVHSFAEQSTRFGLTAGKHLLRRRGELLERSNAHLYETGGMRRVHLRGHHHIWKRLLVHASGFNLGLLMRMLTGFGTPRSLQDRQAAVVAPQSAGRGPKWTDHASAPASVTRPWTPRTERVAAATRRWIAGGPATCTATG